MCEHFVPAEVLPILRQLEPSDLWHYSQEQNRPQFQQKYGIEVLGIGSESFVFVDPRDDARAIAVKYHDKAVSNTHIEHPVTSSEAERIRCLHAIFGILFPNNFPPILHVEGRDKRDPLKPTGTIRQRIKAAIPDITPRAPAHPFKRVYSDCIRWGIPLAFDLNYENFILGISGQEWYCDLLQYDDSSPYADPYNLGEARRSIECYMEDHQFPKREQTAVQTTIRDLFLILS